MGYTPVFDCFASAAGTAQLLTTSYAPSTFQPWFRAGDFKALTVFITVSGTTATSLDWRLVGSDDAGTTSFSDTGTEVSAGVVTHQELVEHVTDDTGAPTTALTQMIHFDLSKLGADVLGFEWKRNGGDATTAVHVTAQMKG